MTAPAPLHILRAGRHVAMDGRAIELSTADLAATAAAYDPALHEAPLVVGHPRDNGPAYGWVAALSARGEDLEATPHQVDSAFAELVSAGRFKKLSASLYRPDAPSNPAPGVWYLRHVGFLGAQPPAVKGLRPVTLADDAAEAVTLELSEGESERALAAVLRSLREWLLETQGVDTADRVVPEWRISMLEETARAEREPRPDAAPSRLSEPAAPAPTGRGAPTQEDPMPDTPTAAELAEREQALTARATELAEREARLQQAEAERHRAECAAFVEGHVRAGRVLPREQAGLAALLAALTADQVLAFGEGEDRTEKPAADWLRELIAALPVRVEFAERASGGDAPAESVRFAAPPGYGVDAGALDLHHKALAYQASHPDTEYLAAVRAVSAT